MSPPITSDEQWRSTTTSTASMISLGGPPSNSPSPAGTGACRSGEPKPLGRSHLRKRKSWRPCRRTFAGSFRSPRRRSRAVSPALSTGSTFSVRRLRRRLEWPANPYERPRRGAFGKEICSGGWLRSRVGQGGRRRTEEARRGGSLARGGAMRLGPFRRQRNPGCLEAMGLAPARGRSRARDGPFLRCPSTGASLGLVRISKSTCPGSGPRLGRLGTIRLQGSAGFAVVSGDNLEKAAADLGITVGTARQEVSPLSPRPGHTARPNLSCWPAVLREGAPAR